MGLRALRVGSIVIAVTMMALVSMRSQGPDQAAVQQRVAQLKQAIAQNQAKLKKYTWLQTTTVAVKDETKKEQQEQCQYGPDGKVVKTPVGPPPAPPQQQRGLKGKIVGKKIEEMKDYIDRSKTLISHYVPPEGDKIQAVMQAGKASVNNAGGMATVVLADYYKPGDKVRFSFDTATKKLQSYDVNSYLDDPEKDVVTMTNQFASLPDGTNYLQQTVLDLQGKQIKITTVNGGHSLLN